MSNWIAEVQDKAAARVRDILAKPMPEDGQFGVEGEFDPWEVFPALYGSYDRAFDECVLDVLRELRDENKSRRDLASEMVREMLCTAELCDYGTSPRACFPTQQFRELLPALIEKWESYVDLRWNKDTK